ncbi:M15 family metallopeptidase, partial [Nocardioides sp.]|uniref:M15 family metallopeptidase n=1 Tax=Nocardioides sp. TaxID=35761 RepID=UPI002ED681EB
HWGKENSARVTRHQKALARDLSRAGAAVVVGTHTHRLQGSGWLGTTYVSYGLGNFIWYHGSRGETGLLDLAVRDGRVVADGWRPALIPPDGGLPTFLSGTSAARARTAWRKLRQGSGLTAAPVEPATFSASVSAITGPLRRRMSSSYRSGCPVPLGQLRYLRVSHWDFDGRARQGELVVAAKHADAVVDVFADLFAAEFPIERMQLVSDFGGDDERSMAANNTSAFNCRRVAGTDRWSQHSYGAAIDLNPVQNPYVTRSGVSPRAGAPWAQPPARRSTVPGLITADSVVVRAFRAVGWSWGGDWDDPQDYQHFSAEGS